MTREYIKLAKLWRGTDKQINASIIRRVGRRGKPFRFCIRQHWDDLDFDNAADTDLDWSLPTVDMDMIINKGVPSYYHSWEVYDVLKENGYTNLGWMNGEASIPDVPFQRAYKNDSGSTTIRINEQHKLYYSVDMGD